ncbi:MAG: NTP transferase domain-containing protein [Terracidiphilus sp.]
MSEAARDAAPDAVGFVLAGGRSSRMGEDKALLRLGGQPLVAHALGILRKAGLAASVAGAGSALGALAPVVEHANPGLGPLGGICAALASTTARRAVFLPAARWFLRVNTRADLRRAEARQRTFIA